MVSPLPRAHERRSFVDLVVAPSSVFPSPPPAFQLAPPSREKVRLRSITAARLSTHIFDCSANMPKFIPRPSSSASDCDVARTMPAASSTIELPSSSSSSSFRLVGGDEFARSGRCAQSNSILLRPRCNSSHVTNLPPKYSISIARGASAAESADETSPLPRSDL